MSNLADYFAQHRPRPRYAVGDRVQGTYQGTPFVGTIYTDNMRNTVEGPRVSVHLDLPLKAGLIWLNYIRVDYASITGLR